VTSKLRTDEQARVDNDRLHAVLIEPQVERFRHLGGVGDAPLTVGYMRCATT